MWGLLLGAIVEGAKKIFGSGIEKSVRVASRAAFFLVFSGVIMFFIDFFLSYVRDYSFAGVDGCTAYLMNIIGLFPALGIFLQIISLGFWARFALKYFSDTV